MKHCKGSSIAVQDSSTIIPLFDYEASRNRFERLPRFSSEEHGLLCTGPGAYEYILSFIRKLLASMETWDHIAPSVVVALRLFMSNITRTWLSASFLGLGDGEDDPFSSSLSVKQSWKLVQDLVSYDQWLHFVLTICHSMHIVTSDHPLIAYSAESISQMNASELDAVVDILQLNTPSRSPIAIQKHIRDFAVNEPARMYAVLPPISFLMNMRHKSRRSFHWYRHSCIPTARLELTGNQLDTVSVTALYDIFSKDDVSICCVRDGTVEQRDSMLQLVMGKSCICARCRLELSTDQLETESPILATFSRADLVRLGRYYMSQAEFKTAAILYQKALRQQQGNTAESESMSTADICHALGAIELSLGHFLKAQRIWDETLKDAQIDHSSHAGLQLQRDKLQCYGYLQAVEKQIICPSESFQSESPAPGCFVTPILNSATCEKIIRWAEDLGTWTKHRHYEVPTFDIPVHTVTPLLDWFQNQFMIPLMAPLLAQQFKTSPHGSFYVHDAFCVRYEAGASSNHLPIHTDESTHSLVISLNDDFDGGGTYLLDHDITIRPVKGSVLSFRGDQMPHGGEAVTRGVRYILAVFLYFDGDRAEGDVPSKGPKRKTTNFNELLIESKRQKLGFSFDFDCSSK